MNQQTLFKVRDLRQKDQFKIDDVYLNGYAKVCGKDATIVYMSLCRHAEYSSQKAWPSQEKIAYEHGISTRSVKRGLKKLMEHRIIFAEQERASGRFTNYIYTLLDKSGWKQIKKDTVLSDGIPSTGGQNSTTVHGGTETVGRPAAYGVGPTKDYTEQRITHKKDTNSESTPAQQAKEFFLRGSETFTKIKEEFVLKIGGDDPNKGAAVLSEIYKFVLYWTEPNGNGTKQRWQLQPTFDVRRRLYTWFSKEDRFRNKQFQRPGAGVTI